MGVGPCPPASPAVGLRWGPPGGELSWSSRCCPSRLCGPNKPTLALLACAPEPGSGEARARVQRRDLGCRHRLEPVLSGFGAGCSQFSRETEEKGFIFNYRQPLGLLLLLLCRARCPRAPWHGGSSGEGLCLPLRGLPLPDLPFTGNKPKAFVHQTDVLWQRLAPCYQSLLLNKHVLVRPGCSGLIFRIHK